MCAAVKKAARFSLSFSLNGAAAAAAFLSF